MTEKEDLELRKVVALESIASSLKNIQGWLYSIDKEGWSDRIQWYLSLVKEKYIDKK